MPRANLPSIEYIRQCFEYRDGKLYWLERPRDHFSSDRGCDLVNNIYVGKEAGCLQMIGRYRDFPVHWVRVNYISIKRSHIVWALHKGEWPKDQLDHENRNSTDDVIDNLRPASNAENSRNTSLSRRNKSGYKGVSWSKERQKWCAYIGFNGTRRLIGRFDDPEEAHAAYMKAAREHFGEFATDGVSPSLQDD